MLKGPHLISYLLILLTPLVASANISQQSNAQQPAQLVYELRTYTSHPGKLEALENRFRNHTMALFEKHGIINVSY
ncbi:MAG: NIPSNAP family protein, partial [Pseudomonadota bacterium]|nr:NIPSNAP family protein [Pseudomonadota bacterium]